MSVLQYLNQSTDLKIVSTSEKFLQKAKLVGTGISTLTIYDGTDATGRVVGVLGCVANSSDYLDINEFCPNGVYTVLTTGAGLAKAIIYDR